MAERSYTEPRSIDQLSKQAQDYDYNPNVPFIRLMRSATAIQHQAKIYEHENDIEQTFLLLFRHADLVLQHLMVHPEAKKPVYKAQLRAAEKDVFLNLQKLESLRPKIIQRHDAWVKHIRERDARRAAAQQQGRKTFVDHDAESSSTIRPLTPDTAFHTRALEAGDHKELAVKLAQREITRRATARKATRQAGISQDEEHRRRTGGVWGDWETELRKDDQPGDTDDISQHLRAARSQVDRRGSKPSPDVSRSVAPQRDSISGKSYYYPSIPAKQLRSEWSPPRSRPSPPPQEAWTPPGVPEPPPKEPHVNGNHYPHDEMPPPRPDKVSVPAPSTDSVTAVDHSKYLPSDDKASSYTFKPAAWLENGNPLRTIFLPPDLRNRFLSIAQPNTNQNLETCGVLCGTLVSNALFISKLVIPDQESTSDTCETINESALFDYCDSEDLMVLGWIHTHPTQTCFMSSRDLHTHCGYQVMMPESIAIVCAPSKEPSWGCFRLTDPPGMKSVLNCHQTGLFHPHAESNIYTEALRPGHVVEASGLRFDVVDLRPGH